MKKSLMGILMTTVMLLSLAAPLLAIPVAADDADWYMTVPGVLKTDYYSLYPYQKANLEVGFSKFGELINSADNVGLEYNDAVDPYAYPAGSSLSTTVPKRMWVQGWFINVTYEHRTLGERWVWAGALHSDSVVYGNDWIRVDFNNDKSTTYGQEDFRDPGYFIGASPYGTTLVNGGRKTNGTCVTEDIEVLYDGPREFIAVCRTTLYDHLVYGDDSTESDVALLQLAITIRFDKVKKCVVLYKDVKSLLVEKEGIKMKIQFSNRGEVDLGTASVGISSYAHFWTEGMGIGGVEDTYDHTAEGLDTVYDSSYQLIKTEDPQDTEYPGFSAAGPYPQDSDATFDYAQAINPSAGYAWSAAFWPSLSDWSLDGWDQWWHSMSAADPHYIDYRTPADEPFIPFYIGEWDFVLYHNLDSEGRTQFRGVTQYAVTARTDGNDVQYMGSNVVDDEMNYYLQETFNPWDLVDAVHKDTIRHVAWTKGATSFTTKAPAVYVSNAEWDDYCVFAERILRGNSTLMVRGTDYTATYNSATGTITFSGLPSGVNSKILYSTEDYWYNASVTYLTEYSETVADPTGSVTFDFSYDDDYTFAADPLGTVKTYGIDLSMEYVATPGNYTIDYPNLDDSKWDFGVSFEDAFEQTYFYYDNITYSTTDVTATVLPTAYMYAGLSNSQKDVWVDYMDIRMHLAVEFTYITGTGEDIDNFTMSFTPTMSFVLEEERMGRYEWVEVGRDAASVDSAGAALVAEVFDSWKHIGVGIGGADMDNSVAANKMPFVMSPFAAGTSVDDYKDSLFRAALKDDWCTYWPVASSNMIGVGGPLANLLSYYVNDFTDAFYGLPQFSGAAYSGAIAPISCWNRNWDGEGYNTYPNFAFGGSTFIGYAVISTYKDINGTVIFDVWGNEGRDTYYASMWLHGDEERGFTPGIVEMQSLPRGVTSIVLGIGYFDPMHPVYFIPELLGTISETGVSAVGETDGIAWYYGAPWNVKGGIHDP